MPQVPGSNKEKLGELEVRLKANNPESGIVRQSLLRIAYVKKEKALAFPPPKLDPDGVVQVPMPVVLFVINLIRYKVIIPMNKLKQLPPSVFQLPNLQLLDVACNWLTAMPKEISNLASLQVLDASYNQLNHSVASIPCLPQSLQELYEYWRYAWTNVCPVQVSQ